MDFHSRKEPVALVNCQVKESKFSSTLELHMHKNTEVLKSPTKLDASAITSNSSSDLITLDELPKLDQYQTVSVNLKVINIKSEEEGLVKQDCVVGDPTGTARITLWEDNVGVLAEGDLSGVKVRSFKGQKYLSIPKIGFQCMPIADIGTVCTTTPDIDEVHSIDRVQVQGVKYFDTYRACYSCKAKVNPTTDTIGKCTRCQSIQRLVPSKYLLKQTQSSHLLFTSNQ